MKTRTLLLLSLASGLAIMLAGAVFLFQLAAQEDAAPPVAIGTPARVGDMTVAVLSSSESSDVREIEVEIGGVDDPDGASTFRLLTSDRVVPYDPTGWSTADACTSTTVEPTTCWLRFGISPDDGPSRQLQYTRGDQGARFALD